MLTDISLERRLRSIVARVALVPADSFSLDDEFAAAGLDSLSVLRIVAEVEEEFGFVIPDEEFGRLRTMRKLLRFAETRARGEVWRGWRGGP